MEMESEMECSQQQQLQQMEESSVFERSVNSKTSDLTSVFDPRECDAYRWRWSPEQTPARGQPEPTLSESMIVEKITEARESLRSIFDENVSRLFCDIHRAIEDVECGQEIFVDDLHEREALTRAHGESLVELAPEMAELVALKMSALSRSLEQLRVKHDEDARSGCRDQSAAIQLRKWLQTTEQQIERIKAELVANVANFGELQRLRAALQALQLEIDTEGRHLLRAAERHLTARALEWTAESRKILRLKRNFDVLKNRWCVVNLAGVELLERINGFVERFTGSDEFNSDRESVGSAEPARKRARRLDAAVFPFDRRDADGEATESDEDVIPFASDEYEKLMSDSPLSNVEYENHRGQRVTNRGAMAALISPNDGMGTTLEHRTSSEDGWSSSKTHDVGYSSGENSIHEALNAIGSDLGIGPTEATQTDDDLLRMRERPVLAVSAYYRTVPLDDAVEGGDQKAALRAVPTLSLDLLPEADGLKGAEEPLSDSLVVCPDEDASGKLDDYTEVMRLLDEGLPATPLLQMGTSWSELRSAAHARRISAPARSGVVASSAPRINGRAGKGEMSCDASSEDSDGGTRAPPQMSASFGGRSSADLLAPPAAVHHSTPLIRKRRLPKAPPAVVPRGNSLANSLLQNLGMNESIYEPLVPPPTTTVDVAVMSASLNGGQRASKRRVLRRRMRRATSDGEEMDAQAAGEPQTGGCFLYARRNSMESNASSTTTTTTTTFMESGDAHFEWDEYREDALIDNVSMAPNTTLTMNGLHHANGSSTAPILEHLDVDEDFQTELPLVDVNENVGGGGLRAFLRQSRNALDESLRLLQHRLDKKSMKSNKLGVRRLAQEHLQQIAALLRSLDDGVELHDLDELERLHEQWLRLIAEHKIPSKETISAVDLNKILEQFRLIRAHHAQMQDAELKLDAQLTPSASFDDLHSSTMDEEKDSAPTPTLPAVARPALLKRVGAAVAEQLPLKSILSCLLLMGIGLALLAMVADEDVLLQPGHWSFKFGPHIRYVRGPPPV
ncbi:CBN-UNC-83 protein [Aphelenchoides fujianensis]|nr:CBN-UNC-83 protein [Aphelenchoides fujianensis]